jgi:hypothetical protein
MQQDISEAPGENAEGAGAQNSEHNFNVRTMIPETEPRAVGTSKRNSPAFLNHLGQGLYTDGEHNNGTDQDLLGTRGGEPSEMGEGIKVPLSVVWKKDGTRARLVYDARFALDDTHGGSFTPWSGPLSQITTIRPSEHCTGEVCDTMESHDTYPGSASEKNHKDDTEGEMSLLSSV